MKNPKFTKKTKSSNGKLKKKLAAKNKNFGKRGEFQRIENIRKKSKRKYKHIKKKENFRKNKGKFGKKSTKK